MILYVVFLVACNTWLSMDIKLKKNRKKKVEYNIQNIFFLEKIKIVTKRSFYEYVKVSKINGMYYFQKGVSHGFEKYKNIQTYSWVIKICFFIQVYLDSAIVFNIDIWSYYDYFNVGKIFRFANANDNFFSTLNNGSSVSGYNNMSSSKCNGLQGNSIH